MPAPPTFNLADFANLSHEVESLSPVSVPASEQLRVAEPPAPRRRSGGGGLSSSSRESGAAVPERSHSAKYSDRINGPFLKGPIPMRWIRRSYPLCPGAKIVAMELWWRHGMEWVSKPDVARYDVTVVFNLERLHTSLGVTEKVSRAGVKALEAAGLIEVTRAPGHALRIRLCEVRADDTAASLESERGLDQDDDDAESDDESDV